MKLDLTNDPIALLMDDHERVAELFEAIAAAGDKDRQPLVQLLTDLLATHMDLEEEHLYPLVREQVGEEEADEAKAEHRLARQSLETVRGLAAGEPGFDGALESLRAGIVHHVEEEEGEVFPALRNALDDAEMERLLDAFAPLRESLEASGHLGCSTTEEEIEATKGGRRTA